VPLFIDIHDITGATPEAVADAHAKDVACQQKHGVNYVKYWLNEPRGKIFCLCTAPDAEAARIVHLEAHGMLAERILEVDPDLADSFLGDGPVSSSGAALWPRSQQCDPGIRTLVFTDIVGSTAITQRLGDHAAMHVVDQHDRIVRAALGGHAGREVKHLGDGIMAVFDAAMDAVRCALAIQGTLRSAATDTADPVRVRIGVASGEPVERQGDFFGSTVQLAARLCAYAQPGQTLVSSSVTSLCTDVRFEDLGDVQLKGFEQPTRAHALVD
jgi:class 3 adenylate cyclase